VISIEEVLTIGEPEGREELMFSQIGIAVDNDENLYVLDRKAVEIRVFSRDGEYLRSFGEKEIMLGAVVSELPSPALPSPSPALLSAELSPLPPPQPKPAKAIPTAKIIRTAKTDFLSCDFFTIIILL
jgi:hypothetical protein